MYWLWRMDQSRVEIFQQFVICLAKNENVPLGWYTQHMYDGKVELPFECWDEMRWRARGFIIGWLQPFIITIAIDIRQCVYSGFLKCQYYFGARQWRKKEKNPKNSTEHTEKSCNENIRRVCFMASKMPYAPHIAPSFASTFVAT